MNTGFKIGILVMGLLMLACCGGAMTFLTPVSGAKQKREREARSFGDTYTVQILRNWDVKEIVNLATPEYKNSFKPEEFQEVLDGNHKALGEYQAGRGSAMLVKTETQGKTSILITDYENNGTFSRGKAKVKMKLRYQEGRWSIDLFSIEPS